MGPRKTNAGLSAATHLLAESHFHRTSGETTSAFWRVLYLVAIKMESLRCVHTLTPALRKQKQEEGQPAWITESIPGQARLHNGTLTPSSLSSHTSPTHTKT